MPHKLDKVELLGSQYNALKTYWVGGKTSIFHYFWLRDNCTTNFHPDTYERTFDLLSVSDDIHPTNVDFDDNNLIIDWSEGSENGTHQSMFSLEWLYNHAYSGDLKKDQRTNYQSWSGDFAVDILRVDHVAIMQDDTELLSWMKQLDKHGIIYKNKYLNVQ